MFYLRAYGDRENKRVTYMDTDGHDLTFFFFNDTATTEIYTLSLHDALPISVAAGIREVAAAVRAEPALRNYQNSAYHNVQADRKSTRLNSSHSQISHAVFCLKKKIRSLLEPYDAQNSFATHQAES